MTSSVPDVRIGMVTGRDEILFSGTDTLIWENGKGERIGTSPAGTEVRVALGERQPADIAYFVRLAIHENLGDAERQAKEITVEAAGVEIYTTGLKIPFGDFSLDNREHWVLVGPFQSTEDAVAAQSRFGEPWETSVVRNVRKPPAGVLLLPDAKIPEVLRVRPQRPDAQASLHDVTVGIGFHWQHLELQSYRGILEIGVGIDGRLQAINEVPVEEYLASVSSSEMSPDCHLELLRAQTVVARSTLLATMGKHHHAENYHLCADDHCQCYHGSGAEREETWRGVRDTWGEVLTFGGRVCDARYSKICGGAMEDYANVWDGRHIPYLVSGTDGVLPLDLPYDDEESARRYIDASPDVYCNTSLYSLPEGQRHSRDLFRWEVTHRREELEEIIKEKSGRDVGELLEIRPLRRGPSGRLVAIEVIGSRDRLRVGKELAIRHLLSRSHLYSSCFYTVARKGDDGQISHVTFRGAGWGHGVGLCQIGATVMASKGIPYQQILAHYYRRAKLRRIYSA